MDLPQASVDAYLTAFVTDQQLEFEGEINPLIVALRNQSRLQRRIALICLLCVAVTAKPHLPVERWLPGVPEPERHHVFFRAIHDQMMAYHSNVLTQQQFMQSLGLFWHLTHSCSPTPPVSNAASLIPMV